VVDAFRRIIHKFNGNAEVLLMNRRDRPTDAADQSSSNQGVLSADDAAWFCEAGIRYMRTRQNLDALICCERALAINPNCSEALHLMGRLSLEDISPSNGSQAQSGRVPRQSTSQVWARCFSARVGAMRL
jgi:hypothetical protein